MAQRLIAGGAWTQVWIQHPTQGMIPVGLATGASYDEDWAVNPAEVVGYHGPIDYDSQGYTLSITLQTFVPQVPNPPGGSWPDGGSVALADFLPTRSEVQSNAGRPGMFDMMHFVNLSTGATMNEFRKVIIASNGVQIAPNSFVTANVRMMGVERTK